jgi:hypothetical protein
MKLKCPNCADSCRLSIRLSFDAPIYQGKPQITKADIPMSPDSQVTCGNCGKVSDAKSCGLQKILFPYSQQLTSKVVQMVEKDSMTMVECGKQLGFSTAHVHKIYHDHKERVAKYGDID